MGVKIITPVAPKTPFSALTAPLPCRRGASWLVDEMLRHGPLSWAAVAAATTPFVFVFCH